MNFEQELTIPRSGPRYESCFTALGGLFRPKRLLEMGTHLGRSLVWIAVGSGRVERVVSVDSEVHIASSQEIARQALLDFGYTGETHFLVGDPADTTVQADIMRLGPYDFIHIDANHTYEACLANLQFAQRVLSHGGVILVHDAVMPELERAVYRFRFDHGRAYIRISTDAFLHGAFLIQ